jgi:acetyl-CoA carboxylase carboxyltransferase component
MDVIEVTVTSLLTQVSWQPEIDEIRRREALARAMHAAGRLTVRERIDQLLDPGTFHEIGSLAGRATYDDAGQLTAFTPSNFVVGTGRIDSRQVVVGGDDFTVRGGAARNLRVACASP